MSTWNLSPFYENETLWDEDFWNKQRGHWPCGLNFNIIMASLAAGLFLMITIEKSMIMKQRKQSRK